MEEPKQKHLSLIIGILIGASIGLFQGSKMEATSDSDLVALVIAFLIIIAVLGVIGYVIDKFIHKKQLKDYYANFGKK